MRRPRPFPEGSGKSLETLLSNSETKVDYRRVLAVWLRFSLNLSTTQIAVALGIHPSSVLRIQSRYFREGFPTLIGKRRGGRRRENVPLTEEGEMLAPFLDRIKAGHKLNVSEIKGVYEEKIGHQVPKSTIYRMLKRHGWRRKSKHHP